MKLKSVSYYIGLIISFLANIYFFAELTYFTFLSKDQNFYSGIGGDFELILLVLIVILPSFIVSLILCIFEILEDKNKKSYWKLTLWLAGYLINFILFIVYKIIFRA